jgi:hypothetical protein
MKEIGLTLFIIAHFLIVLLGWGIWLALLNTLIWLIALKLTIWRRG